MKIKNLTNEELNKIIEYFENKNISLSLNGTRYAISIIDLIKGNYKQYYNFQNAFPIIEKEFNTTKLSISRALNYISFGIRNNQQSKKMIFDIIQECKIKIN